MEANFVLTATDLTADFSDGIRKLFSDNARLYIRVEYGSDIPATTAATTGKRRGRKPGPAKQAADAPKKRGPKPGSKRTPKIANDAPKKRGRKPKVAAEA